MANKNKVESMRYLIVENGVYYFRKVIPAKLAAAYGKKVIKRSLLTGDLKTAKLRLMAVSLEVHTELDALSTTAEMATHKALILDAALIDKLSALYKRSLLQSDDRKRNLVKSVWGAGAFFGDDDTKIAFAKSPMATVDFSHGIRARIADNNNKILALAKSHMAAMDYASVDLDSLLKNNNIELIAPTPALLNTLKQSMLRARIAYFTEAVARDTGEHTPTSEMAPPVVLDTSLSDGSNVLSLYDLWLKQEPRQAKTAAAYLATANNFNEYVKGIPAAAIKGEQVRDWVAHIAATLAHKTVENKHKHLIAIGELGVRYDKLVNNPFKKAIVSEDMGQKAVERRAYTVEEITKLLTHIGSSSKVSVYDKWVMLLGYSTGARQREICQLQINDVEEVAGVWTIKITKDGKGQVIKNPASRRRIPLHPDLISAGFIRWLDTIKKGRPATARIFPFTPDKYGNPAAAYSKRYGNMATKVLGDTSATCYHSFRHHYIGRLRLVPGYENYEQGRGRLADLLTGHASDLVVDSYDKGFYPVAPLLNIVNKVKLVAMPTLNK